MAGHYSKQAAAKQQQEPAAKSLLRSAQNLADAVVELYLTLVIAPFLQLHETFYTGLNKFLRRILDQQHKVPAWFTANFITYARTLLVFPTILLLAAGGGSFWQQILPAALVLAVDFGDFLDGVVARFWVDQKQQQQQAKKASEEEESTKKESPSSSSNTPSGSRAASPASSDKDSFEVVTTGSPHALSSWVRLHRNRTYGGFVDAVCDKAYVIPCWIMLLSKVPGSRYLRAFQYLTLCGLIAAETASGCIRFRAYFTSGGVPAPSVQGFDFSTSAVKADHVGKAKQTFEMVGTALFILGFTRYAGLLLLALALPLAYESVRRKVVTRVIYVTVDCATTTAHNNKMDHRLLKFWMQAAAMGSKLVVGVVGRNSQAQDMVLNACASSSVDTVIAEAPLKADLMFLEKQKIDFVVMAPWQTANNIKSVTDEVVDSNRVLSIGEDNVARPVEPKVGSKTE